MDTAVVTRLSVLICAALGPFAPALPACAAPIHAIAMHGEPKYPADFKYFDYVNPDAPKGGSVAFGMLGSVRQSQSADREGQCRAGRSRIRV